MTPTRLIRCPKCKAQLRAPAAAAKIKCPKCAAVLKLPGAAPATPPPLPPPPPPPEPAADEPLLSFEGEEAAPEPLSEVLPEPKPEPEPAPPDDLEPLPELPESPEPEPAPLEPPPEREEEGEPETPAVRAEDYPTKADALLASPPAASAKRPARRPPGPKAVQLPWRWETAPQAAPRSLGLLVLAGILLAAAATAVGLGFLKPEWLEEIGGRISCSPGRPYAPAAPPTARRRTPPAPEAPPPAEETSPPPTPGGTP